MRSKAVRIVAVVILLGLIAWFWIVPAIDKESMKVPVVNAISGVRSGNIPLIRAQFTEHAAIQAGESKLPIDLALKIAEPELKSGELRGSMRFGEYSDLQFTSKTEATADFSVIIVVEGNEDLPYNKVPLQKKGHVVLQRTALWNWKIKQLSSDDPEFEGVLKQ